MTEKFSGYFKMKVVIPRRIPDVGPDLLRSEGFEVVIGPEDAHYTRENLIEMIQDADAVIPLLSMKFDREVVEAAKQLKIIANYAVGYDNIDLEAAREKGIVVTNTPEVLTDATADLTWALLLSVARHVVEADKFVRDGKFRGWSPFLFLGQDFVHRTLGVIGFGRIGQAVARRALGFNMNILYYSRSRKIDAEEKLGAKYVELRELLRESDFVTLHTPLTEETYHLIGEEELKMMKSNAIIVNMARGPVIDEKALIKALQEKWIYGAGLDVYENEPNVPKELIKLDNVILLPHLGSATYWTRNTMSRIAAEAIIKYLKYGEKPWNTVLWKEF